MLFALLLFGTGCSKKNETRLTGYTDTLKLVNFKGNSENVGKIDSNENKKKSLEQLKRDKFI